MTTYLIVGNGIAANTAAENIRANDREGEIIMFSVSPALSNIFLKISKANEFPDSIREI